MEAQRLSDLIRAGYDHQPAPGELDAVARDTRERERLQRHLLLARHSRAALDALLREVIGNYRSGTRQVWAPFLLEVVGPTLGARLARYHALEPHFSEDDIHQQLVVEVLEAALEIDLPQGARWLDKRLVNRAAFRLNRQLHRELKRQRLQVELPSEDDDEPDERVIHDGDVAPRRPPIKQSMQQQLEKRGLKRLEISEAKARRLVDRFGPPAVELLNDTTQIYVRKARRRYSLSPDQPDQGCGER